MVYTNDIETALDGESKIKVTDNADSKLHQNSSQQFENNRNEHVIETTLEDNTSNNDAVEMENHLPQIVTFINEASPSALVHNLESPMSIQNPLIHNIINEAKNVSNVVNTVCGIADVDEIMEHKTSLVDAAIKVPEIQKPEEAKLVLQSPDQPNDIEMLSFVSKPISEMLIINTESSQSNSVDESNSSKLTEICNIGSRETQAIIRKPLAQNTVTSLSVIASAYDTSDSESDEVDCVFEKKNDGANCTEMEVQITKEYRNKQTETSDEDSDSEDSGSSEESASSSVETVESDESDDSDGNGDKTMNSRKKNERHCGKKNQEKVSKGEFDNLPPIEDLKISVPEVLCDPLGEVGWMVEQMVVVRPKPGKPTLNLDTILFVERGRRVLGRIFDVFGQVSEPHYCVRFNSTEHIKESDIKVGMTVYFCPNTEYTSVVFLQDLLKMKVTDELNEDEHPEFSDDEEERAYFAALKQKQNNEKPKSTGEVPQKRQRTTSQDSAWKSNHPWSSGRKQQQPGKNHKKPDWPANQQQNSSHPPNLWNYPSTHPNNPWPRPPETYQSNAWHAPPPQNPYGYSEQFGNRQPRPNGRPFFRPPHSFHSGPNPYTQNRAYTQQSNPVRYPAANFPWRAQNPRQSGMTWPQPPPPPPGI